MPLLYIGHRKGTKIIKDPYASYVNFLMHMDSIPFVDSAGGRSMAVNGTVTLSSSGKFNQCAQFSGSSYLSYPFDAALGLDALPTFTAEAWINPDALRTQSIMSTRRDGSTGFDFRVESTGAINFYHTGGGSGASIISAQAIYIGVWNHVAVSKDNGVASIYINGVFGGSKNIGTRGSPTGDTFRIGAYYDGGIRIPFRGLIDEIRITPGIARYSSNFDVPSLPYSLT